jgi:hypothetical protein
MSPILKAIALIESYGEDFDTIMAHYFHNGYVYSSKDLFALAKREENDLFIYLIVGHINNLLPKIDFIPENIRCVRKGEYKIYDYKRIANKIRDNKT